MVTRSGSSAIRSYIVGVAESPLGKVTNHSEASMAALASQKALNEAGLRFSDVDGLFVNYMGEEGTVRIGEYLGIEPRYADSSDLGGGSFQAFLHHAMIAIAEKRCSVALITYASRQRSKRSRTRINRGASDSVTEQFDSPYGLPLPMGNFALVAARHMYQYGTTREQMAAVAVLARKWAQLNPKAWSQDDLTIQEVLDSQPISEPLTKLDCCLITDGGGAVVVTSADRAKEARVTPIRILGAGESHTHWNPGQAADLTTSAAVASGRDAFGMAGVRPSDIEIFEPYDACTITPIIQAEDLGFCAKGEGGAFFESSQLLPGGSLPTMTSGGGLSYCHPGALGILLTIEAVRQLRGEAGRRQVGGKPTLACVNGLGGTLSVSATVVLARE